MKPSPSRALPALAALLIAACLATPAHAQAPAGKAARPPVNEIRITGGPAAGTYHPLADDIACFYGMTGPNAWHLQAATLDPEIVVMADGALPREGGSTTGATIMLTGSVPDAATEEDLVRGLTGTFTVRRSAGHVLADVDATSPDGIHVVAHVRCGVVAEQ